jgi:hypothetical protein
MAEYICVNDEEANCGTVHLIKDGDLELWVHTGYPRTRLAGTYKCNESNTSDLFATPSTMEIVPPQTHS